MIYREDIIKAYDFYKELYPLDIKNNDKFHIWKSDYQLSLLKYSRVVSEIRDLDSFNNIIKSDFDYDNLFIIIESLIKSENLKIWQKWKFIWNWLEKNKNNISEFYDNVFEKPNSKYNQFPCDIKSKKKRIDLFFEKYPYVKKMNIWVFWDDDLLSIDLYKTSIYIPVVYEIDEKIINIINLESSNKIKVIKWDILNNNYTIDSDIDTFIIDPPYNINWIINFTNFWVKQINKSTNEFFIIFNKMMLWNYYFNFMEFLANICIFTVDIKEWFSLYNFPENYRELIDLNENLRKYNYSFTKNNFSSSSSLFQFEIWKKTNKEFSKLIYNRY